MARARRDLPVQHPRQGDGHRDDGQPRHLLRRGLHFPHHVRTTRVERHLLPVRGHGRYRHSKYSPLLARGLRRRARGAKRRRDYGTASSAPCAQPYAPPPPLSWQLRRSCSTASSCPRRRACGSRRSRHSSVTPRPWSGATSAACARWWGDPSVRPGLDPDESDQKPLKTRYISPPPGKRRFAEKPGYFRRRFFHERTRTTKAEDADGALLNVPR